MLESEHRNTFVEYVDGRGVRVRCTWGVLARALTGKLNRGYTSFQLPANWRQKVPRLIQLLSFALDSPLSNREDEAGVGGRSRGAALLHVC